MMDRDTLHRYAAIGLEQQIREHEAQLVALKEQYAKVSQNGQPARAKAARPWSAKQRAAVSKRMKAYWAKRRKQA